MKKDKKEWYGVKCIFFYPGLRKKVGNNVFEERVTVWKARSFDKAIKKAEKEAKKYSKKVGCIYTKFCNAYWMFDNLEEGTEVYSLMRETKFDQEKYLDKFYDTGNERTKK